MELMKTLNNYESTPKELVEQGGENTAVMLKRNVPLFWAVGTPCEHRDSRQLT